jgi:Ca2+:H+ antiporter
VLSPLIALLVLALTWGRKPGTVVVVGVAVVLGAAVLSAVTHAEIVAHRVGEPFGSLVLAVAVTVIEVALIVTLMVSGGPETSSLARDTVFAAVMITCNGIVGLALLVGGLRYSVILFNAEGTGAALATIATLATLSLVLPTFTTSRPGPEFSPAQLTFAALASVILYGLFVLTQTVRHRDFFLPVTSAGEVVGARSTRIRRRRGRRWQVSAFCWPRLWRWSGWPRSNHPPSKRESRRSGFLRPLSGWLLPCSCCCLRRSRRPVRHAGTVCRPASTSPSDPRSPASG